MRRTSLVLVSNANGRPSSFVPFHPRPTRPLSFTFQMGTTTRRLLILLTLLAGCLPTRTTIKPDYERIVRESVANLSRQRSFAYTCRFRTATTEAEFHGHCLVGRAEHVRGLWKYPRDTVATEIVALRSIQYEKKDGDWELHNRGEESNILVQIERTLKRDRFEFLEISAGCYIYSFKPNLVFLDPMMKKEIRAIIGISRQNHLPSHIHAMSTDSSLFWDVEIRQYNKALVIDPPRPDKKKYRLMTLALEDELRIGQRLLLVKIDHALTKGPNGFNVEVPLAIDKPLLADLLAPGEFAIYDGTGLSKETKVSPALDKKIAGGETVRKVTIEFDKRGQAHLKLAFNVKHSFTTLVALVLDRKILAVKDFVDRPGNVDKLDILIEMDYPTVLIAAAKITSGPIKPLTIGEAQ